MLGSEAFNGVDGAEHLCEIGAGRVEIERDVVTVADHPMVALRQAVAVDLETMAQAWLHDPVTALDRCEQTVDIGDEVVVDAVQVLRNDGAEQQPAEARCRIDRQHQMAERDPSRGHCWTCVPDLDLCQQHGGQT